MNIVAGLLPVPISAISELGFVLTPKKFEKTDCTPTMVTSSSASQLSVLPTSKSNISVLSLERPSQDYPYPFGGCKCFEMLSPEPESGTRRTRFLLYLRPRSSGPQLKDQAVLCQSATLETSIARFFLSRRSSHSHTNARTSVIPEFESWPWLYHRPNHKHKVLPLKQFSQRIQFCNVGLCEDLF